MTYSYYTSFQISFDDGKTWKQCVSIQRKKNTNLIKRLAARGIIRAALKPN